MKAPALFAVIRGILVAAAFVASFAGPAAAAEPPQRILVYGDSNTWGWQAVPEGAPTTRYPVAQTWPARLQALLGWRVQVEVDALSGRTVDQDYPEPISGLAGSDFNGARTLPAAIARNLPLDLVVIMLGTNDFRSDLQRSPEQIAASLAALRERVAHSAGGVFSRHPAPRLMLVLPPAVGDVSRTPLAPLMAGAREKSLALPAAVSRALGSDATVPVVDAARFVQVRSIDGVHLEAADHAALARALVGPVRQALRAPPR